MSNKGITLTELVVVGAACALVIVVLVMSLGNCQGNPRAYRQAETKVVFKKMERLEARAKYRWMTGDWQPKTETYYYVVAEDGTACELGIGDYAVAKEGAPLTCPWAVLQ